MIAIALLGIITELVEPTAAYCEDLPAYLQSQVAPFPSAICGRYRVTCPSIDDMTYFTLEVPASGTERGRVISLSGGQGTSFHTENLEEYVDAELGFIGIAYEQAGENDGWLCAKTNCPQYANLTEPGVREAACRPATIIEHYRPPGEAYCAQGHSSGSAQLSYALAWHGAEAWLDYVQLTGWQPFARMDYGCDPSRAGVSKRSYTGTNPNGRTQTVNGRPFAYADGPDFAPTLVDLANGFPENTCKSRHLSGDQATRAERNSAVSSGADYIYPQTVIDHYACISNKSITDGNGSWWLEKVNAANPGRIFMKSQAQGFLPQKNCTGEQVWWKTDGHTPSPLRQLTIDRMAEQCIDRH